MNNIYKVIWSKAKNCYVVASEIARSHTKSASGSEKIGGVTRRKLLASLMALSLLCGGLGVAEASVHVVESGETYEVLTKQEVKDGYGTKDDVKSNKYNIEKLQTTTTQQGTQIAINTTNIATNKANISALQTTATEQGKLIETNTANIANNTTAIEKKINAETANERFATKDALNNLERVVTDKVDENTFESALDLKADTDLGNLTEEGKTAIKNTMLEDMNLKADKTYVDAEVGKKADKATTLDGYGINDAYTKTDADRKFATSDALNTAKTDLEGKIAANTTKIDANKTDIDGLKTKAATTETTLTDLSGRMTTAESTITDLKDTDVRLEGKIGQNANDITGLKDKDVELSGNIGANKTAIDQNKTGITQNKNDITTINGKLTTAEGSIAANKNAIDDLKTKVGTVNNGTYLDSSKPVGENLNKLNDGLVKEVEDRKAADTALSGRIDANANTIAKVNHELENTNNHFNTELGKTNAALQEEGKVRANADAALASDITATNKRTAGIKRDDVRNETTIEGNVTVDSLGNVTAKGQLTGKGVDAGDGTITTKGAVNAGSLTVENASNLKGDVTMDNKLAVTGDTSLKKTDVDGTLNVTGESSLKNTTVGGTLGVTGETKLDDKLTVKGEATFKDKVTMDKDLEVKGELKTDKIAMEHTGTDADGTRYNSATTITADGITHIGEVEKSGVTTKSSFTHNEKGTINYAKDGDTADWTETRSYVTASGVSNKMTDSDENRHTYSQTATESMEQLVNGEKSNFEKKTAKENIISIKDKDAAGNVISLTNKQTVDGEKTSVTNKDSSSTINQRVDQISNHVTSADGKKSSTEVKADGITNTSKDGTITNDAKDIVNNATGNMTNTVGGNQTNQIDGNQENTIGGSQTTIVTGDISNKAKNITNEAETKLTDKVGTNTRVIDSTSITDTVGTTTNRKIEDGKITDTAGDSTVTTKDGEGTTFAKTGSTAYSTEAGAPTDTNIAGNHITTGRVDANELGVSDKDGANTAKLTVEAGEDGGVKASASNGTTTGSLDVTAKEVGSSVKDDASGKGSTFKQRIDAIMGNVKTDAGESEVTQKGDEITSVVGKGEATNSRVTQKKGSLEAGVTDGTNTNASYDVADASAKVLSGGTKVNKLQDNLDSSEKTITNGTYKTSKVQTALDITNTAKDGTITNDAKNIVNNATGDMTNTVGGKQTNKIDGDQVNTIGGSQTTTVTGDISNTAKNITNEANTKLTDKVGDNTRVLDSEGITDTVPGADGKGSTFKQRIDAIMGNVKTDAGESEVTQKGDEITSKVGLGEATNSRVTQKKDLLEAAVTDGTNYNISNDTANASAKVLTDGTKVNKLQDNLNSSEKTITNGTYTTSKVQTALDITNTAKDGTITNDAKNIVNNATGDMTNTVGGKLTTTVTGQATENFEGGLKTDITGEEIHTVTGNQTNKITGKQTNTVEGGQENIISGGQINNITGDQTTTISGTQTTTARDINRNASSGMIDTIDNAYGTNTETKVAGKTTTDVSIKGTGEKGQYIRGANESRDYLIKGTLKNSETKTAEATSTEITDGNGKTSSTIQDVTRISGSVTDGTNTSVSNVKANSIDSAVTDGSSISTINQKKNSITSQVTDGTTITKTEQDTKNITNTAKDGTITNDAKDIVNNASGNMTNTVGGDLTTTVRGNELHEVTGKQTNKIDGDQENTIGGNQTTTVTGDISNKAENITNEANTKLTDKVGENTRVLDSEGITDTVGGSTFKQRIDKIMMESKDVSIKAEETLTNEAKVITNKASEVINNEAVNINNTATGIIKSKASEIQNQADKLISNKVGENTWENMENGKITTSIKDGAKQNLTQSDAAGTTQSTVDGGKSTVTIQNADGLADAVTDGTNTSVQNQTASAIAAAVKDGAGNENASVANATTSVNTIKSGSKANTVISTADGTSFINSEAAAPVGDGTEVKTTIKGNTITTGKVTMDYAEVMKDLGVRGNANITGKTTTGSLEVTGTSTLKGDVTMGSNATVKKDLTVEGNTNLKNTKVDGTLDVTQKATFGDSVSIAKDLSVDGNATIKGDVTAKSYKVGDKTYISAAGINANDQKITNVADGSISEGSKDAVNGGQLYGVKNDLEGKVNKVGANAAAMANLHPMEFDPDSKWNIAAAIGNYGSETAAALGAFYRPNDDVMVNLSTAFGTGENMVGGGVSVRLGKSGNKLSREESNALKDQVNDLTARMDALLSVLNPNMSKDFPDVPENHWAYEAVSRLAGNDIVQGYPDGEFHGERTMTRYEMAEIIYNALSRGAEAEKELVEEFKPELQAMAASEKATAEKAEG